MHRLGYRLGISNGIAEILSRRSVSSVHTDMDAGDSPRRHVSNHLTNGRVIPVRGAHLVSCISKLAARCASGSPR